MDVRTVLLVRPGREEVSRAFGDEDRVGTPELAFHTLPGFRGVLARAQESNCRRCSCFTELCRQLEKTKETTFDTETEKRQENGIRNCRMF